MRITASSFIWEKTECANEAFGALVESIHENLGLLGLWRWGFFCLLATLLIISRWDLSKRVKSIFVSVGGNEGAMLSS